MVTEKSRKRLPPYISYKSFRNFIDNLQQTGIPSRIDRSYWGERLSGSTGTQLMAALRFLGLVDTNGVPDERLRQLVMARGEARTAQLRDVTNEAFAFLLMSNFDLQTAGGIATYRRFVEQAADLVVSLGGSISGEHGDGQSRGELLPKMYGEELMQAFREFKALWDPDNKMNPGKLVSPYRLDEHLRAPQYRPPAVPTHFAYPVEGSFPEAAMRCVGVGKCRKTDGGAMCPSFMATRDEQHATRGRARLPSTG